jgi:hypothetical protein
MGTGYSISIGYISGHGFQGDKKEAMAVIIVAFQKMMKESIDEVVSSAIRLGAPEWADGERIEKYVAIYNEAPENGCPWRLVYRDGEPSIHIMCSGGGASRTMKEIIARTFCHLLFTVACINNINLNITVV